MRGMPQLPERHPRRLPGQDRIGLGGILSRQHPGLVLDNPDVDRVDLPGGQRGERLGQPRGDRARIAHLLRGRLRGQVQLEGQLIGGELIGRPGTGMPGGVLGIAAIEVHSARAAIRRAAEMIPIS